MIGMQSPPLSLSGNSDSLSPSQFPPPPLSSLLKMQALDLCQSASSSSPLLLLLLLRRRRRPPRRALNNSVAESECSPLGFRTASVSGAAIVGVCGSYGRLGQVLLFIYLLLFPRVRFPVVRHRSEGLSRGGGGVGETQWREIRR